MRTKEIPLDIENPETEDIYFKSDETEVDIYFVPQTELVTYFKMELKSSNGNKQSFWVLEDTTKNIEDFGFCVVSLTSPHPTLKIELDIFRKTIDVLVEIDSVYNRVKKSHVDNSKNTRRKYKSLLEGVVCINSIHENHPNSVLIDKNGEIIKNGIEVCCPDFENKIRAIINNR